MPPDTMSFEPDIHHRCADRPVGDELMKLPLDGGRSNRDYDEIEVIEFLYIFEFLQPARVLRPCICVWRGVAYFP